MFYHPHFMDEETKAQTGAGLLEVAQTARGRT